RQQVRRKLDALEPRLDRRCDGLADQCLRKSRHPLQQDVPVAKQGDEQPVDDLLLSDYNLGDLGLERLDEPTLGLDARTYLLNVNRHGMAICSFVDLELTVARLSARTPPGFHFNFQFFLGLRRFKSD